MSDVVGDKTWVNAEIITAVGLNTGGTIQSGVVTDAKQTSPNNSVYKTLLVASVGITTDLASVDTGKYIVANRVPFLSGSALNSGQIPESVSTMNFSSSSSGSFAPYLPMIYLDDADYTVGGLTQKLRIRAQVNTNATAWSSVTATFGLYPVTFAGTADALTITLGTVVPGSTVPAANPAASTPNSYVGTDFNIPTDGQYVLGFTMSATLTNNAIALGTVQLQTRNV